MKIRFPDYLSEDPQQLGDLSMVKGKYLDASAALDSELITGDKEKIKAAASLTLSFLQMVIHRLTLAKKLNAPEMANEQLTVALLIRKDLLKLLASAQAKDPPTEGRHAV